MRIAIVAPEYPPDIGGMERYAWELAHGIARHGYEVTVFTIIRAQAAAISSSVEVCSCLTGDRWLDAKVIAEQARKFDVWHITNAAWVCMAQRVKPVFVSVHGNDFLDPNVTVRLGLRERFHLPWGSRLDFHVGKWLTAHVMRQSLFHVEHVFANSNNTEALFLARYPSCKGKTSVAYVGVSDIFLQSAPAAARNHGPSQLITICRLNEQRKNVDVVLRALARIKNHYDFRYTVIGDGFLRPELDKLAGDLGLRDRVAFVGECSDVAVRDRLLGSDLFVLTSSASPKTVEGFGIAYLEANACGVPVLAARLGGAVEAVAAGRSGMFVKTASPEAIAESLTEFLAGRARFDADVCRAFAQEFSWSNVVDRVLRRYAETADASLSPFGHGS